MDNDKYRFKLQWKFLTGSYYKTYILEGDMNLYLFVYIVWTDEGVYFYYSGSDIDNEKDIEYPKAYYDAGLTDTVPVIAWANGQCRKIMREMVEARELNLITMKQCLEDIQLKTNESVIEQTRSTIKEE